MSLDNLHIRQQRSVYKLYQRLNSRPMGWGSHLEQPVDRTLEFPGFTANPVRKKAVRKPVMAKKAVRAFTVAEKETNKIYTAGQPEVAVNFIIIKDSPAIGEQQILYGPEKENTAKEEWPVPVEKRMAQDLLPQIFWEHTKTASNDHDHDLGVKAKKGNSAEHHRTCPVARESIATHKEIYLIRNPNLVYHPHRMKLTLVLVVWAVLLYLFHSAKNFNDKYHD
mgnify:CR=1 FL=1